MIKRLLFFLIFFVSAQCFSQCTLQLTSVSVSCYGGTDGEITAYASNGAPGGYFLFQRYFLGNPLIFGQINATDSATFLANVADTFIIVVTEMDPNNPGTPIPGGCVMQDTIIVTEPQALNAGISSNTTVCESTLIFDLYAILGGSPDPGGLWTENGNIVSNMFDPGTHTAGIYTLTYTVSSSPTCLATAVVTVTVNPFVSAGTNGSHTVCENDSVFNLFNYLTGSPDVGGIWTDVNNIPVPNMFNPSTSGSGTFIFTYTVLGAIPCPDTTAIVTITVNPLPAVTISGTTTIPQGMSTGIDFTLTSGTAPFTVVYDDGAIPITSSFNSTIGTIIVTPNDTTTYTLVSVTDANGCTATANDSVTITVVIFSVNYAVDSVTTINESCCGNDGVIQIHVSGIDDSLKYSVDSGQTWQDSSRFFFLSEGDYYVAVEDTNGFRTYWPVVVSIFADSTPDIDMSVHVTPILCNGDSNATLRVLYPDTNCYSYELWRFTIGYPYQILLDTGTHFTGLIAGSYGVIATSKTRNCIDSSGFMDGIINEPPALTQNGIAVNEVRCSNNGICDGEISLSALPTGGTPPYYYSILNFGSNIPLGPIPVDSSFTGLCTGSFQVKLQDSHSCSVFDAVFVPDESLYIDSIITTNVTCFGYSDGTAIVYASGGYQPYSYNWSNGETSDSINSLTNNQYSVIVSDTQNCVANDSVTITQPGELLFNIKITGGFKPETCKGISHDGEFYMDYLGGTAPFNWSWISASGAIGTGFGDTISNLTFDTLTISITDSNGCIGRPAWIHADSVRVEALNASNPLTLDTIIVDSTLCFGTSTANISIDVESGAPTYIYSIDSGLTFTINPVFTNLSAGNYSIEVQDVFGCSVYENVSITEASEIIIILDNIKHVDCYEWELNGYGLPGYIEVHGEGGSSSYQYLWNPSGSTFNIANSLSAGMHTVSVFYTYGINSDICMKTASYLITEPQKVISMANITSHVSCFGENDGSAFVHSQGGTPYTVGNPYDYSWREDVPPINPIILSPDSTIDGLSAGTYIVSIHDTFGCPSRDTVIILEPNEFLIDNVSITSNLCFGDSLGEIIVIASGGTMPYNELFAIDALGNTMMGTFPTISGLAASNYEIWVVDTNGCLSNILEEKIGEPGEIEININNLINSTCFQSDNGMLEVFLISGTSPYEYNLSESGSMIDHGKVNHTEVLVFDTLSANSYLLSITDDNSCQNTYTFTISEPAKVIANFTSTNTNIGGQETFTVNLTNTSSGADIFLWDYDDGNQEIWGIHKMPTHSYNKQGQYEIMLVAENSLLSQNCNDTAFATINVQGFDIFNVFSPNNDGVNDIFSFDAWGLSSLYVEIYNRWGTKIYHWDSPNGSWNGRTYNNDPVSDGVYYFFLKANGEDGYLYEQQGSITLLR